MNTKPLNNGKTVTEVIEDVLAEMKILKAEVELGCPILQAIADLDRLASMETWDRPAVIGTIDGLMFVIFRLGLTPPTDDQVIQARNYRRWELMKAMWWARGVLMG